VYRPSPSEKQLQQFHQHFFLSVPDISLTIPNATSQHVQASSAYSPYQLYQ